jgi:hypothetical protein
MTWLVAGPTHPVMHTIVGEIVHEHTTRRSVWKCNGPEVRWRSSLRVLGGAAGVRLRRVTFRTRRGTALPARPSRRTRDSSTRALRRSGHRIFALRDSRACRKGKTSRPLLRGQPLINGVSPFGCFGARRKEISGPRQEQREKRPWSRSCGFLGESTVPSSFNPSDLRTVREVTQLPVVSRLLPFGHNAL